MQPRGLRLLLDGLFVFRAEEVGDRRLADQVVDLFSMMETSSILSLESQLRVVSILILQSVRYSTCSDIKPFHTETPQPAGQALERLLFEVLIPAS